MGHRDSAPGEDRTADTPRPRAPESFSAASAGGLIAAAGRPAAVIALQRTAGNRGVGRMVDRPAAPSLRDALAAHTAAHAHGDDWPHADVLPDSMVRSVRGLPIDELTQAEQLVLSRDTSSGSAAQPSSCLGVSSDAADDALFDDKAEEFANRHGIKLTPDESDKPMPVGYKPHFLQTAGEAVNQYGTHRAYTVRKWHVMGPGDDNFHSKPDWGGATFTIEMDAPGPWIVAAEMHVDGQTIYLVRRQTIVDAKKVADDALAAASPADYVTYRALMSQERLKRAGANLDQSRTTGSYITNEGPQAANPATVVSVHSFTYLIHPDGRVPQDRKPLTYRWWAIPRETDMNRFKSRTDMGVRTDYKGELAFYLGQGERASFRRDEWATIEIVCEVVGADGKLVDTASYEQVIAPDSDLAKLRQLDTMERDATEGYRKIQAGKAIGLTAIHLDVRRGKSESLSLFTGPAASDGSRTLVVDLTPGAEYVTHEGTNLNEALTHLEKNNSYAKGEILVQIPGSTQPRRLTTKGESDLADAAGKTGIGSMVLVGLGVVAGLVPGVDVAAPFLIAAGLGAGAASGGMALADELRKAKPSGLKVGLDVASIVGSLMGLGGSAQAVRMGSVELAMATATGRFFIYTGFAFDAAGGILLAADTAEQIEKVRSSSMSEDDKIDAIEKLLVMAAVAGGLIAFGAHDLATARARITSIMGEERLARLRPDQVYMLQALDESVLRGLQRVPQGEFEAVAAALAKDPKRAATLSKAYGQKFIEEVRANPARSLQETGELLGARSVEAGGGAVGGTRGADVYKPDPGGGIKAPSRFKRGIEQTASRPRLHKVKVDSFSIRTDGTGADLHLAVGSEQVAIAVVLKETKALTGGAHSATGGAGPGRIVELKPPAAAGGGWSATVELDQAMRQEDVRFVLGHELDEIADFIATRGAAGIGSLRSEGEAGLFVQWAPKRDGSPPPQLTSHDRANAREFLTVAADVRDLELAVKRKGAGAEDVAKLARRRQTLDALSDNMGFADPQNFEAKVAALRGSLADMDANDPIAKALTTKVPDQPMTSIDMIVEALQRRVSAGNFRIATAGTGAPVLDDRMVAHLMRAQPQDSGPTVFRQSGIYGGHHDPSLHDFVAANPEYAILLQDEVVSGGVTYRAYTQYRWHGAGPPPKVTDARYPTAAQRQAGTVDAGWIRADKPKTTFDNPDAFLPLVEDSLGRWRASPAAKRPQTAQQDRTVEINAEPKIMLMYDFTPAVGAQPDQWKIQAIFLDETWLASAAAAAATPTPPPTPVR